MHPVLFSQADAHADAHAGAHADGPADAHADEYRLQSTVHLCPILTGLIICVLFSMQIPS